MIAVSSVPAASGSCREVSAAFSTRLARAFASKSGSGLQAHGSACGRRSRRISMTWSGRVAAIAYSAGPSSPSSNCPCLSVEPAPTRLSPSKMRITVSAVGSGHSSCPLTRTAERFGTRSSRMSQTPERNDIDHADVAPPRAPTSTACSRVSATSSAGTMRNEVCNIFAQPTRLAGRNKGQGEVPSRLVECPRYRFVVAHAASSSRIDRSRERQRARSGPMLPTANPRLRPSSSYDGSAGSKKSPKMSDRHGSPSSRIAS